MVPLPNTWSLASSTSWGVKPRWLRTSKKGSAHWSSLIPSASMQNSSPRIDGAKAPLIPNTSGMLVSTFEMTSLVKPDCWSLSDVM